MGSTLHWRGEKFSIHECLCHINWLKNQSKLAFISHGQQLCFMHAHHVDTFKNIWVASVNRHVHSCLP